MQPAILIDVVNYDLNKFLLNLSYQFQSCSSVTCSGPWNILTMVAGTLVSHF